MSSKATEMSSGPTALDTVFTPPTPEQWAESALAGLPANQNLESLQHTTLDGLLVHVLYDKTPVSHDARDRAAAEPDFHGTDDGQQDGDADSTQTSDATWDNRLAVYATDDNSQANRQILAGLNGGNTSVELPWSPGNSINTILDGVKLELAGVHFLSALDYPVVANEFHTYIESKALDPAAIPVSFNADPVSHWLTTGIEPSAIRQRIEQLGKFTLTTSRALPRSTCVLVDVSIHHNAGASATQELHAAMATGTLYLESLLASGLSVQQASEQIVFKVSCDADILMGVVKLRSLQQLWTHLLEQFATSSGSPSSSHAPNNNFSVVAETSRRYLSRMDPWNNHLRNIAACSAAAMGNSETIIVHPHDRIDSGCAAGDTATGERMARNLPIILARESGLTGVFDPWAGSYAIENLTEQLSQLTWQSLASMGDSETWLSMLRSGQWQSAIGDTHAKRLRLMTDRQQIVIGVNRYEAATDQLLKVPAVASEKNVAQALSPVRDAETFEALNDKVSESA